MAVDHAALKTALAAAPYVGESVSKQLNLLNTPAPGETEFADDDGVPGPSLWAITDATEYAALAVPAQRRWAALVSHPSVLVNDPAVRTAIRDVWSPGTTRSGFEALRQRKLNRIEKSPLGAEGDHATRNDIIKAEAA